MVKGVPGVKVTCSLNGMHQADFGEDGVFTTEMQENDMKQMDIVLTNVGNALVELAHCEMMKRCRVFTLNDSKKVTDGMGTVQLKPGEVLLYTRRSFDHQGVIFFFFGGTDVISLNAYSVILAVTSKACRFALVSSSKLVCGTLWGIST